MSADVRDLRIMGAAAGVLFISLFPHWYTATSPYGTVDESGWGALVLGRIVLVALMVLAIAAAVQSARGRDHVAGLTMREAVHLLVGLAALATAWLALRFLVAPHFAEVRSSLPGMSADNPYGSTQDESATDAIVYHHSIWIVVALVAAAAIGRSAHVVAQLQPGGFDKEVLWQVFVRYARHRRSGRSAAVDPRSGVQAEAAKVVNAGALPAPGAVAPSRTGPPPSDAPGS